LLGFISREGEYVTFSKDIIISEDPTIYVWLTKIENSMQICLAHKLHDAINEQLLIDVEE